MTAVSRALTPTAERRAAPRRQPAVNTVYRFNFVADHAHTLALVWNISTTGISVLVPKPLEAGTLLTGSLDKGEGNHVHPVAIRVVHCKLLETGDYALGARFDPPLSEEELKPFVADA